MVFCKMEDPLISMEDCDDTPVSIKQHLGCCEALACQNSQALDVSSCLSAKDRMLDVH